jgi:hypothetical protein
LADLAKNRGRLHPQAGRPVFIKPFDLWMNTGIELTPCIQNEAVEYLRPFTLTKFDTWSHEREVRAFNRRGKPDDVEHHWEYFTESMNVKEVILGVNCLTTEDTIRELVADYP